MQRLADRYKKGERNWFAGEDSQSMRADKPLARANAPEYHTGPAPGNATPAFRADSTGSEP
jgi:hypothetical protein